MSFKCMMVHVDPDGTGDERVRLAAELAGSFGAHLIGISGWAPRPAFVTASAVVETAPDPVDLGVMEGLLTARGEAFCALAGAAAKPEWRSALDLPTELIVQEAASADLVIVGGSRGVLRDPYRAIDPGAVVLRAGRPVLVVPPRIASLAGKRIAVAWKSTREARRAVRDALPFLQRAESVGVVEFRVGQSACEAPHPASGVTQYLARHGVNSLYERIRPVDVTVTNSLFHFVEDEGIDLIVAGGYGHSRLGEWIFGGVTRDLLIKSPVCCLLSH
jgi:nucleotide-binding universal stress UspA family protein